MPVRSKRRRAALRSPYALEFSGDWQAAANAWHELGCPYEEAIVLAWYGDEPAQLTALRDHADTSAPPPRRTPCADGCARKVC